MEITDNMSYLLSVGLTAFYGILCKPIFLVLIYN